MNDPSKPKGKTTLTGPEKAAIFLALVGEELAGGVAAEPEEKEMVLLRQGVHRMAQISPEDIDEVVEDACRYLKKANIFAEGTSDYLQRVLNKAMGPEKAAAVLSRIFTEESDEGYGIDTLHEMDAKVLAQFLQEEHPQTVAFILAHLYPAHAGEVFSLLPEEKQPEIAHRITHLGSTSPGAIEEVSKVLRNEVRQVQGKQVGGVRPVAEILNFVDSATEERVMTGLNDFEPELADSIRQLMFTFDDLSKVDDQSMQVMVREVEKDSIDIIEFAPLLMLGAAQEKAQELIAQAEAEAEQIRESARQQGAAEGREEVKRSMLPSLVAFADAGQSLIVFEEKLIALYEPHLVQLALEIAEKVIGRVVDVDDQVITSVLERARAEVTDAKQLRVLLHPDDLEVIREMRPDLIRMENGGGRTIEVLAALDIGRGGLRPGRRLSDYQVTNSPSHHA